MKKLLFLIIPLIIIVGYACERSADDPVIPIVPTHTYKASAETGGKIQPLNGKAAVGATVHFTMTEDVGYEVDSFFVNGVLTKLTNLNYNLKVEDSDYEIEVVYKKTLLLPLIAHPWKTARYQVWNALTMKLELDLYPPDIDVEKYTFSSDFSLDILTVKGVTEHWKFVLEDSIFFTVGINGGKGAKRKIVEISDTILVIEVLSPFASQSGPDPTKDSVIRYTYKKSD